MVVPNDAVSFLSSHTFYGSLFSYALRRSERTIVGTECLSCVHIPWAVVHSFLLVVVALSYVSFRDILFSNCFVSLALAKAFGGVVHSWENKGLGVVHHNLSILSFFYTVKTRRQALQIPDFASL